MLTQVKLQLGKVVYKGDFLPLLRKYRQDQDAAKLTSGARLRCCHRPDTLSLVCDIRTPAGLRAIADPLLPNHKLIHALATLLPSALQQTFLNQPKVSVW